jgi:hypothetical protein
MYNIYEPLVNISGTNRRCSCMVPYVRRYREIIGLEEEDIIAVDHWRL